MNAGDSVCRIVVLSLLVLAACSATSSALLGMNFFPSTSQRYGQVVPPEQVLVLTDFDPYEWDLIGQAVVTAETQAMAIRKCRIIASKNGAMAIGNIQLLNAQQGTVNVQTPDTAIPMSSTTVTTRSDGTMETQMKTDYITAPGMSFDIPVTQVEVGCAAYRKRDAANDVPLEAPPEEFPLVALRRQAIPTTNSWYCMRVSEEGRVAHCFPERDMCQSAEAMIGGASKHRNNKRKKTCGPTRTVTCTTYFDAVAGADSFGCFQTADECSVHVQDLMAKSPSVQEVSECEPI